MGFGLHERLAWDVVRSWGLRGAGKAARVWAWGNLILRWVCVICRILYSQVVGLGFREDGREDLTLRSCRGGVGRGGSVVETGPGGVGRRWN